MSAPKITPDQVSKVARLARLSPSPEEVRALARDLGEILRHFETLNEVDTSGVEPTAHAVNLASRLRPDQIRASLDRDVALSQAPHAVEGGFSVPKVLEVES
jgi:aspartyl-tRNA(Asn)/glutamyl-tRNA(Gln) amidotransferase subunit C